MADILLVEDDRDLAESRQETFSALGHSVRVAHTAADGLAQFQERAAATVVTDLRVPSLDDACAMIRGIRQTGAPSRIIVVSGYTETFEKRSERDLVDHVLEKPVKSRVLLALLAVALPVLAADPVVERHAPILERRANAVGTPSDVPMLLYAERLKDQDGDYLQYSVVFSNEDGGTSTAALMARWGRTTDIEHVYRVWIDASGNRRRATIQTTSHQDVDFNGPFEGDRPLLAVITDNNMVGPGGTGRDRAVLAPILIDLTGASREKVMDERPEMYRISAEELAREGKSHLIADPRHYLYIEAEIANQSSRLAARVRLRGAGRWYSSHRGNILWAIERDGFIRTTVALPPGTTPGQVAAIAFDCILERNAKTPARCRVPRLTKAFFLGPDYRPGPSLGAHSFDATLDAGEMIEWTLPSK